MSIAVFKRKIWAFYRREGRHDMSWRRTRDPYKVLVSEIMLQQTQVSRVEGFYKNFISKFPDFEALAAAKTGDVLTAWQGLGYNRRALFLQRAAQEVVDRFDGVLPRDREALESLPGIGKGTSGSLRAFAFNEPDVFIETNIRRVYIHFFFKDKKKVTDAALERYIKRSVDQKNPREWYWALMDYGAAMSVAKEPTARAGNPNRRSAHYKKQSRFTGSDREIRGKIVRLALASAKHKIDAAKSLELLGIPKERFEKVVAALEREKFVVRKGKFICIT